MTRARAALVATLVAGLSAGCGAAAPSPTARAEADHARWTREAAEAWGALSADRAAGLAERAITLSGGDDAREIAARAHLALGRNEAAVRALTGVTDAALLRLRAQAQIAARDFQGALDSIEASRRLARGPADGEDPWAEAMRLALTATVAAGEPYEIVDGERADLALEALALPVVRVRVDTVETLAVVGTGVHFAVLDPSIRNQAGAVDELQLGALRVRNVPHTVRSLDALSEALGAQIGAVIGADLLMRLHATLDGPGGQLTLHSSRPRREGATTSAPLLTLSGSFLAVAGSLGDRRAWLTVDTAGLFPIALGPDAASELGLDAEWEELDGGASFSVAQRVRLGALEVEGIPLIRGLLDEGHARAVGAPVAGSVGWTLLGQLTLGFDPDARSLRFE